MKKNSYLVIIPTYNEVFNIIELVRSIIYEFPDIDILIIDDSSPDGTSLAVEFEMLSKKQISIMKRAGKLGIASAYIDGFKYAMSNNYTHVVQMDADGSHQVKDLKKLIASSLFDKNCVIIGSRYIEFNQKKIWRLSRFLLSKGANIFARFFLKINMSDITSGFRVYPLSIFKQFNFETIKGKDFVFQIEMSKFVKDHKIKVKEIGIDFIDRVNGKSKMDLGMIIESFIYVLKNR